MARLPIPGLDAGSWGNILNDFLSQAHSSTGNLKPETVGTQQLQDGSISESKLDTSTQAKLNATGDPILGGDLTGTASNAQIAAGSVGTTEIAAGSVTSAKLAPGSITSDKLAFNPSTGDSLRSLLVYYAPPNIMNAKYDNDYAAAILSRYDDVVLGVGLEDPSSPEYANTGAIIQKTAALSPATIIWGYIDAGVTTGNHTLGELHTQIDQWITLGAKGILCDVIGYAYGVSRARQNDIVDYIHSKGIGAILNVFNPDEVFSSAVNPTYNPTGTPTHADSRDVYLLESWVYNSDAFSSPYYATFSDVKTRGDAACAYRTSLGIRIFTVNVLSYNNHIESEIDDYRGVGEALARIWRLDGYGISGSNYASTGGDVGVTRPRRFILQPTPYRPSAPYALNGGWTAVEAVDLGITVNYDSSTHTWQQL